MPSHSFLSTPITDTVPGDTSDDLRHVQSLVDSVLSTVASTLVGKAVITQGMDHITITLPYHVLEGALNQSMLNVLGAQLAEVLGRDVELIMIRVSAPYLDANVLAEWLSMDLVTSTFSQTIKTMMTKMMTMTMKTTTTALSTTTPNKRTKRTVKGSMYMGGSALFPVTLPGAITGVKVQLAGRLMTEPSLPRTVVQSASVGSFRPGPYQSLQSGSYTMVNPKGTYTVKVWLSVQA